MRPVVRAGEDPQRDVEDPWAVVTHAVELSLIYDSRAEGLLCSTGQARKTAGLDYHDAERFADRDSEIADYHPAFHFFAKMADPYAEKGANVDGEPTNAFFALDKVVEFFVDLGWPPTSARLGMEYIAARLSRCGKPEIAYKSLLREGDGPGFLDIGQDAWIDVLRAVPARRCDRPSTSRSSLTSATSSGARGVRASGRRSRTRFWSWDRRGRARASTSSSTRSWTPPARSSPPQRDPTASQPP